MIKLTKFPMYHTAEIFQSLDIKFSFVNADYKQVSNPIKCRDFLGDCLWSKATNQKASIYSFQYNYNDNPFDTEITRLSMKFPEEESLKYIQENLHKLNAIEEEYDLEKTIILKTDDKETLVLEGDKEWQQAPWKISLYTFLLKLFSYEDESCLQDPEDEYFAALEDKLPLLMSKIKNQEVHWWDSINYAHNRSGFVSLLKGQNPQQSSLLGI